MFTYLQCLSMKPEKVQVLPDNAFSRLDEANDEVFFAQDRFVSHLDSVARSTVEDVIGQLILEETPAILDLMTGWESHIPDAIQPGKVVGLGLNENELAGNKALSEYKWLSSYSGSQRKGAPRGDRQERVTRTAR